MILYLKIRSNEEVSLHNNSYFSAALGGGAAGFGMQNLFK